MTVDTRLIRIQRPAKAVEPPPYRGKLMNAYDIAGQIYGGHVSADWVLRKVPGKMDMGHRTKMWWEFEVVEWINSTKDDS